MNRQGIFVSYSRDDQRWLDEFKTYVAPLARKQKLDLWDDTRIAAGTEWKVAIEEAIKSSRVAVFLVTANFLASDFIAEVELPKLLSRSAEGLAIFWIPVGPSGYQFMEFERIQAASDPKKPLSLLGEAERGEAWVNIVRKLATIVAQGPVPPPPPLPDVNGAAAKDVRLFSFDEVTSLYEMLLTAGVTNDDKIETLLVGLPGAYVATLPNPGTPANRLQQILHAVNGTREKIGGHAAFYYILKNSETMRSFDAAWKEKIQKLLGDLAAREAKG